MKLYEHQLEALKNTESFNRCAYYLDMGLGKTFVGSEKLKSLGTKRNIVVCQKSKIQDWIEHFKTYYPEYSIADLTIKSHLNDFLTWCFGSPIIGIINYDLIFRRKDLLNLKDFTLLVDESQIITNPTAKRTKFIMKMNPANVILLSGTPTGGKYEKLWSQLHLLGWNISKDLFYKQYVIQEWLEDDSGFRIPIIKGYKNVDRLKHKLSEHGCIFMKTEEVIDMPNVVTVPITVSTTKPYRKFIKTSIVTVQKFNDNFELGAEVELIGDTNLTKRIYARQLCGHYNADKLQSFRDLISSTDDRLIVFYNFNDEFDLLFKIASEKTEHISVVNGKTKDFTAYENYSDSITLIQYQAGAMGLNLQKARQAVYFTLPESSELFEQSKKRIHRIGQNETCFYYILLCRNSVEERILETLQERKDFDDKLFQAYAEET